MSWSEMVLMILVFSNPKVSDLCPEGSCQQYIARSEVQMVYAKGVDVPMQHTDRQLQYRATQIHYAQNTKTWPTN